MHIRKYVWRDLLETINMKWILRLFSVRLCQVEKETRIQRCENMGPFYSPMSHRYEIDLLLNSYYVST